MRKRLTVVAIFYGLSILAIMVRLFFWQVVKSQSLGATAKLQYQNQSQTQVFRGGILSTDGSYLVASVGSWLLYANPQKIHDSKSAIASSLATLFVNSDSDAYKADLSKEILRISDLLTTDTPYIPVKQNLTDDTKKKIEDMHVDGLNFDPQESRFYPEGSSSAQLLGFVGKDKYGDNVGYFGLEGYYDLPLKGKTGFTLREADPFGLPILFGNSDELPGIKGVDLVTSIDKTIQLDVEQKLEKGIQTYGAKSGNIIVMDPANGRILAMASYPSYDQNKYYQYDDTLFRNPIISDSFEPGSIFKPIIMASALDMGVVRPDTPCDICSGPYTIDKYQIETWNGEYFPNSPMTDVIVHSDNVGMTFVGQKIGTSKLIDYIDKFGFGHATGIDLQGESVPPIRKKTDWNIVDATTATFGQGIAVTPIQIIRAVAAVVNGGFLVKPHIVDGVKQDFSVTKIQTDTPKRIISQKAADEAKMMMQAAANIGEAKWTMPTEFSLGGKTGTAQIPIGGHYDATKTIASFVGFAPVANPKFIMLVTLDEPQSSQWGAETAAPLWASIARDIFPRLGIQPKN